MTRDEILLRAHELAQGNKESSLKNITIEISLFVSYLYEKEIPVSPEALDLYQEYLQKSGYSKNTIRRKLGVVRAFTKKIYKNKLVIEKSKKEHEMPYGARGKMILDDFLSGKKETSIPFYYSDLRMMIKIFKQPSEDEPLCFYQFVEMLCILDKGTSEAIAKKIILSMLGLCYKEATIERKLSLMSCLMNTAKSMDFSSWSIAVYELYRSLQRNGSNKDEPYRLNQKFNELLDAMKEKGTMKSLRDRAILSLLVEGYSKMSICYVPFPFPKAHSSGLNPSAINAVNDWIDVRGDVSGPLFVSLNHFKPGKNIVAISHRSIDKNVIMHWFSSLSTLTMIDFKGIKRYRSFYL